MQKNGDGEKLLQKINSRTNGSFSSLLVDYNICPSCFEGDLIVKDGEKVCTSCGTVQPHISFSRTVPFGENSAPVNELAFNRNLGNTLGKPGLFCVLAHARGTEDLPIRARQIGILVQKFEHPKIMALKRYGRLRVHQWGFDGHSKPKNVEFSNHFGRMLRKIGAFIVLGDLHVPMQKVVDACFALTLERTMGKAQFMLAIERLGVNFKVLQNVAVLKEVFS